MALIDTSNPSKGTLGVTADQLKAQAADKIQKEQPKGRSGKTNKTPKS